MTAVLEYLDFLQQAVTNNNWGVAPLLKMIQMPSEKMVLLSTS